MRIQPILRASQGLLATENTSYSAIGRAATGSSASWELRILGAEYAFSPQLNHLPLFVSPYALQRRRSALPVLV